MVVLLPFRPLTRKIHIVANDRLSDSPTVSQPHTQLVPLVKNEAFTPRYFDSLPTIHDIVIPSRCQELPVASPSEPTDFSVVAPEFLHLVVLHPDIVVPDRTVPAPRGDDGSVPR